MSDDKKIISLGDKAQAILDEKQEAFNKSVDNMASAVKNEDAGAALLIYYTDKNDPESMRFASNTNDEKTLYWMLNKAAQHMMDYGYGDHED